MTDAARERRRRLFFAFWPTDAVRDRLEALAVDLVQRRGGRPVQLRNLHVTLLFLGNVRPDQIERVYAAAAGISGAPFELRFDQVETWPGARVVCLTSTTPAPAAHALHGALRSALAQELALEERDYLPHITLARDAPRRRRPEPIEPLRWSVREFALVESNMTRTGSEYSVLERWPLNSP